MGCPGFNQFYAEDKVSQGDHAVPELRLEPATSQSQVKQSTTETLPSSRRIVDKDLMFVCVCVGGGSVLVFVLVCMPLLQSS